MNNNETETSLKLFQAVPVPVFCFSFISERVGLWPAQNHNDKRC